MENLKIVLANEADVDFLLLNKARRMFGSMSRIRTQKKENSTALRLLA
ncbi:hypothetical protein ACJQOV_000006 [Staphylococcus pseudintermedius]|nr:hypothetical protein [Staphylococcus pseudintermedius]EGQ0358319.1 hypothetical protein [Staphylococcus pseudintermedius]EGQ3137822.1 hypothetical protein [Staphylococcus pseudintermedius]EGQ3599398.1 hypothetical protein [Staphylococcus pseudintermedius]EIM5194389.1 hypothetical protein [Staphylococcus pseudintermedius]EJD5688244.1 hypothetical protein [Staphylococcus pseudintermedius]